FRGGPGVMRAIDQELGRELRPSDDAVDLALVAGHQDLAVAVLAERADVVDGADVGVARLRKLAAAHREERLDGAARPHGVEVAAAEVLDLVAAVDDAADHGLVAGLVAADRVARLEVAAAGAVAEV